jgi:hypothetical protein
MTQSPYPPGPPAAPPPNYGYGYGRPKPGFSGMAIAGFVLAFLFWPLGLIFSGTPCRTRNALGRAVTVLPSPG